MTEQRPEYRHGGPRPGAGRKSKYGEPMTQKTVRLPQEWIDKLTTDFDSFQEAIETLVKDYWSARNKDL
jgi:hypothetical protein